jgi:release factor glutamine methyltransferase
MSLSNSNGSTIATVLTRAAARLICNDAPRLEAEVLLAHVLGLSRADLYAHPERSLPPQRLANYQTLLNRRACGEPLPYLTGHIEFYGLDFAVDPRVLIPRPETETLAELALALIAPIPKRIRAQDRPALRAARPTVADVGTGSGCIAISLAVHAPHVHIYALDLSPDALTVAHANAERHGVADRITFLQSDLLTALPGPVDLIVANPPYVAAQEWPTLPREVREHEPRLALYGGLDGLDVIGRLLSQAKDHLRPEGALLLEIGDAQGAAAIRLAHQIFSVGHLQGGAAPGVSREGLEPNTYLAADITLHTDLAGHDRVLRVKTRLDGEYNEPP